MIFSIFLLVKLLLNIFKPFGFTLLAFLLISAANPQKGLSGFLYNPFLPSTSSEIDLNIKLVGEIIGYSYIKIEVDASENASRYNTVSIPLKGSCYEAINSKNYKVIGSFNTKTLVWKIDCFDNNAHRSAFIGKENHDGVIEGKWSSRNITRKFYLQRTQNN